MKQAKEKQKKREYIKKETNTFEQTEVRDEGKEKTEVK